VNGIDSATWDAIGLTLTLVGLVVSVLVWRRRGPAAGIRGVAWSLLPAAAGLTGTLHLLWQITDSIGRWAVHLVFSPVVWLGIVLAGVSVVLFGVSRVLRGRGIGASARADLPGERSSKPASTTPARGTPAVKDDDMDDIEAILRKHGIQ
jgi:hypothetical protein